MQIRVNTTCCFSGRVDKFNYNDNNSVIFMFVFGVIKLIWQFIAPELARRRLPAGQTPLGLDLCAFATFGKQSDGSRTPKVAQA